MSTLADSRATLVDPETQSFDLTRVLTAWHSVASELDFDGAL